MLWFLVLILVQSPFQVSLFMSYHGTNSHICMKGQLLSSTFCLFYNFHALIDFHQFSWLCFSNVIIAIKSLVTGMMRFLRARCVTCVFACVSYLWDWLAGKWPARFKVNWFIVADHVVRWRLSRDEFYTAIMCMNVQLLGSNELLSLQPIRHCGSASSACFMYLMSILGIFEWSMYCFLCSEGGWGYC